jgi:hypothetical protein
MPTALIQKMNNRTGSERTGALGSGRSGAWADKVVGSSSYKCDEL